MAGFRGSNDEGNGWHSEPRRGSQAQATCGNLCFSRLALRDSNRRASLFFEGALFVVGLNKETQKNVEGTNPGTILRTIAEVDRVPFQEDRRFPKLSRLLERG